MEFLPLPATNFKSPQDQIVIELWSVTMSWLFPLLLILLLQQ